MKIIIETNIICDRKPRNKMKILKDNAKFMKNVATRSLNLT